MVAVPGSLARTMRSRKLRDDSVILLIGASGGDLGSKAGDRPGNKGGSPPVQRLTGGSMADHFFCECDDSHCREEILLEFEEYMFLHRQMGYIVVPGHETPDEEIIAEDPDGRFVYVAAATQPIVH